MLSYLSSSPGIGGELKQEPEDFIVGEIMLDETVLQPGEQLSRQGSEGDFTHFILEKKDWNTLQAISAIGKRLGHGKKRFGYAGNKDRRAITAQLCSAWKIEPEKLLGLNLRDIKINGAWTAAEKVELGGLLGNRFTIHVRGVSEDAAERVGAIANELSGVFPNYFGEQRFGSVRANTHLVGKEIIRGDFEQAVMTYLCFTEPTEMQEAREAREKLTADGDFEAALKSFPMHLKYERTLLGHLAARPRDFVGALRKLPRGLGLMFVHAFQSDLFNKQLDGTVFRREFSVPENGFYCPANDYGFPDVSKLKIATAQDVKMINGLVSARKAFACARLVGYETTDLREEEAAVLASEGVKQVDFKIKSFPEISSKGSARPLFAPMKEFGFKVDGKDAVFSLSLPAGSYATVALREFIDVKKR